MISAHRIGALVYRHAALYRHSWPRVVELAYWPTLNLLIWGFTASWFGHAHAAGPAQSVAMAGGALIAGVLLWEITLRGQLSMTMTFLEEIWSRNLGHLFVSPLRPAELVLGLLTVSVLRTATGLLPAFVIAFLLYHFDILVIGPVLILFFLNLLVMGWWISLGIVSLLFRYGAGAEALAWTIAFGITPVACVYYPIAALPVWLRPLAEILPAAHIFAGMRAALLDQALDWGSLATAVVLNAAWMLAALAVFAGEFRRARVNGALTSIGE
jgi:ABC-2 type transport system permease protein